MNTTPPTRLPDAPNTPLANEQIKLPKRRIDPILQEIYDLKARLNAEAGYSVEKILERARRNTALPQALSE
jgi:hypothetical protein